MNYRRLAVAAVAALIVDALYGFVMWNGMMGSRYADDPAVYRAAEAMASYMPVILGAKLVALLALAYAYAKGYEGGSGAAEGARFGAVVGLFVSLFVLTGIHATFLVEATETLLAMLVLFVELVVVGTVIGAVYRPVAARTAVPSELVGAGR